MSRFLASVMWLSVAVPCLAQPAPQSPATIPAPIPERVEALSKPDPEPADSSEVNRLKRGVEARIQELTDAIPAATQPATTQPTTPRERRTNAAAGLLDALRGYQGVLERYGTVKAEVDDTATAERLAAELTTIQEDITAANQDVAAHHVYVDDEALSRAQKEWEAARQDLAIRQAAHAQRTERLKTASTLTETIANAANEAQAAHLAAVSGFAARWAAASDAAERDAALFDLEAAHARSSAAALQRAVVEFEGQRDQRLSTQADQRLPLLRDLVTARESRVTEFQRVAALGAADRARERIKWTESEFEKACVAVKLDMIEAQLELARLEEQAGLRSRFRDDRHKEQQDDRNQGLVIWQQFVASLHRRPSEQIQARFLQIEQRLAFWNREQESLRQLVDRTYDDRAAIETRMDELDDAIRARFEALANVSTQGVPDVARLRAELAEDWNEHREEFDSASKRLSDLTERLESASNDVAAHVGHLSRIRSRLYWSYLSVPNPPLWRYRVSQSRQEWASDEQTTKRQQDLASAAATLRQISYSHYALLITLIVIIFVGAALARRRLARYADATEERVAEQMQESGLVTAPISDRLNFQGARIVGRAGLVVWPSLAALLWASMTPIRADLALAGLGFLASVGTADALITTVFSRAKPRFRLFPCSNVVATHYRRWLRGLLWFSVIAIPIPLMLTILDWAPDTRRHLWAAYKVIALAVALAFASRRQTVLRVAGRPENLRHPTLFALVSAGYPLLYVFVAGLLVAVVIGYNALTSYIVTGILLTIGTLLVAEAVNDYLRDLSDKQRQRAAARSADEDVERKEGPVNERAAALAAGQEVALIEDETADAALSLDLLLALLRLTVWVGAAGLTLGAWGIRWVDVRGWTDFVLLDASSDGRPAITVSRALVALGIVLLSWIASRTVRSVLESRIYATLSTLDRGARAALSTALHYTIVLFGLYFALYTLRIPLGALTVVLGTLGLGLGLGLQPLFVNFFSGLIMLLERHLKIGDIIEIDGKLAEVTKISVRATAIKTFDNIDMLIPNSEFVNSKVVNWTHRDHRIRGKIAVGVAYGTEPRLVERLLLQVAHDDPTVLYDPAPRVRFLAFGDSSLDFALYAWFNSVSEWWDFITNSRYQIVECFKEHDIEIPFPQRTLSTLGGEALRLKIETSPHGEDAADDEIGALRASDANP